jgi:ABC-2 type transport system permease protein
MKLKKYLRIIFIKIRIGSFYKAEYYAGLVNIISTLIINILLWQAIYKGQNLSGSIQNKMMITYIMLSIMFQSIFSMDEYYIQNKVRDGTIIYELFKPISFRSYVFLNALGRMIFNTIMVFIPVMVILRLFIDIMAPASLVSLLYFIPSILFGFLLLYFFNFIIWVLSFENLVTFGFVEIKNAVIAVLSGAIVPIWFMPDAFINVIKILPFEKIYYFPIALYMGIIPENQIVFGIFQQMIWSLFFIICGHFTWKWAIKQAVIQGG